MNDAVGYYPVNGVSNGTDVLDRQEFYESQLFLVQKCEGSVSLSSCCISSPTLALTERGMNQQKKTNKTNLFFTENLLKDVQGW